MYEVQSEVKKPRMNVICILQRFFSVEPREWIGKIEARGRLSSLMAFQVNRKDRRCRQRIWLWRWPRKSYILIKHIYFSFLLSKIQEGIDLMIHSLLQYIFFFFLASWQKCTYTIVRYNFSYSRISQLYEGCLLNGNYNTIRQVSSRCGYIGVPFFSR